MKKTYIAPQVKEVKINLERGIMVAGSFDADIDGSTDVVGGKDEFEGFEEWSFDWDE